jgi:PAS domain S-box-containing protein
MSAFIGYKFSSSMNDKRELYSISSIVEYLLIAFFYLSAALVTSISVKNSSLPFYSALTTGLMAGILITRGTKSWIGYVLGVILWQIITLSINVTALHLSTSNSFFFFISEGITLLIIQRSFLYISDLSSITEQNSGLNKLFLFSIIAPIPQAIILTILLSNAGAVQSNVSFLKLFHLTWLSISVSILALTPFFTSYFNKKRIPLFHNLGFSWEVLLFLFLLFVPNSLEILNIITPPFSFPLHYLVFPTIFIIAFRKSIRTLTFSLLICYLFTIYTASTNHGIFFSNDPYLNASNIHYFILFFLIISLFIGVVVNEKRIAYESLKKTFSGVESEVALQMSTFRDLNAKLFEEIEHRGFVERELSESRNLLDEAQEIANIASWELNIDTEEIIWSKSGFKVIGFNPETPPNSLKEYIKFIHPDDLDSFNLLFRKASNNPITFETELRHNRFDGIINYVLIRGQSFEENGKVNRVIGLSFDITKRKETEKQISENEEKYRALFESNIDSVSVINPEDKTFVDINYAFEQRYGYSKAEIIGKPYSLITAEVNETYSAIENAFRNGSHRVQTRIHKKKNGEEFYAEGIFVKFIASGKSLIFVISQDITKRKVAEKNLAERELQYRLFFESDLIGMAETTQQKEWITFNNKLCSILGYTAEDLKQRTWDTLTHPDDLRNEMKLFNDVIVHKKDGYSIEKRFIRKDGTSIYCKVAFKAIVNPQGKITHFVKLIEDISARKQIEKDLLESRTTLRRAQQIANLGSWSWNLAYNFISLNDEAYQILGWKKSQGPFNIKNFIELVAPEKRVQVEKEIEAAKKGQKIADSIEIPIMINETEPRYLLLNLGSNIGSSVAVSEIVATMADITEIKKAEIALQEANSLKDQLFSIIAHDLRGPIGNINQTIQYITNEDESIDNDTRKDLLSALKDATQETYNLLENLLDWAKSQRQESYKPEKILIKPAVVNAISLLSSMASTKKITLTSSIDDKLTIYADLYMIKTVLRNVISNSIKFTPNGGNIRIEALRVDSKVILKFIDSGVGMTKEMIDNFFDSNLNITTPGTNNEMGTGLGLKLVKKFISQNKGFVTIESSQDNGTTFIITLPA